MCRQKVVFAAVCEHSSWRGDQGQDLSPQHEQVQMHTEASQGEHQVHCMPITRTEEAAWQSAW